MKGVGWRCDECNESAVVEGDVFANPYINPPDLWVIVIGPDYTDGTANRHFCSGQCAANALVRR